MTNNPMFPTGCRLEPPKPGTNHVRQILGAPGATPIPDQFVVPAFRRAFDDGFLPMPGAVHVKDQGQRPSCVGQGVSRQKEAEEGVEMSARDVYRQAKHLPGEDPLSWGTSIQGAMDVLDQSGAAEESLVPEQPPLAPLSGYVDLSDASPAVLAQRAQHRSSSSYFVPRTLIEQTMAETGLPVVTSCEWYSGDNDMPSATMQMPSGSDAGGHCFCVCGVVRRAAGRCLVAFQSWGPDWGDHGFFYIPLLDVVNRLGNGYVSVDIAPDLAAVLAKYSGLNVKLENDPRIYKVDSGKLRHYPDEVTWWAFGNLFGFDTHNILPAELAVIPPGADMAIADAPWRTAELVRQIRQFYGLK